jgi:hypothetical protein
MKNLRSFLLFAGLTTSTFLTAQQWGDYTLYSVQNSNAAYLVDTNGTTYHTWTFTNSPTSYSTYLLEGGTLLRTVKYSGNVLTGGGMSGQIQKVDWNGNLLWSYTYSTSTYCLHHDICAMPNGNILMICYDVKTAAQATQAGSSSAIVIWPDMILEVQPTGTTGGNIVWQWNSWDHLCQDYDNTKSNYVTNTDEHPELLNINYQTSKEWMHVNGVDYNADLDQIVFSSHALDEVYVIDHSTTTAEAASHAGGNSGKGGDILYRWGNPAAYGAPGTANFNVVHDAHWVPAGCPRAGSLVGFNNNGISNTQSCVDVFYPPYNGYNYDYTTAQAYLPSTYSLRRACSGHTNNMGSSEQFPNGNMLITVAQAGLMYEVDSIGTVLWTKTVTGSVPQSHRYTACYVSGTMPSDPTVTQNGNVLTASSGVTYQWYYNGVPISGATSQTYTPPQSGNYQVSITDANGCRSDLSAVFNFIPTSIFGVANETIFGVYPNPTTGLVNIQTSVEGDYQVVVTDAVGKIVLIANNANSIDLSEMENGIYSISIVSDANGITTRRIALVK